VIRSGAVKEEIDAQMKAGEHDLLILGAPLAERRNKVVLEGVVAQIAREVETHPVLIVRHATPRLGAAE
jgi:hypothetical protein